MCKTNCLNPYHPIVTGIGKEIIKTFDNMLIELCLNRYFLPIFNQKHSTHIQYINIFGDVDLVEIKSSIVETLVELTSPVLGYRLLIKNLFEVDFDELFIIPYFYPHLDRLKFYYKRKGCKFI